MTFPILDLFNFLSDSTGTMLKAHYYSILIPWLLWHNCRWKIQLKVFVDRVCVKHNFKFRLIWLRVVDRIGCYHQLVIWIPGDNDRVRYLARHFFLCNYQMSRF